MFISAAVVQSAIELGFIYALVALALFLSYSMLNVCDLSTDGCYTLGCAVGAVVILAGHPLLAIPAAMAAGVVSGFVTAFLQTKLGVESLLAGIIVNTGLYTINIVAMGKSTLSLNDADSIFTIAKDLLQSTPLADYYKMVVAIVFVVLVFVFLLLFLNTRLGLAIRATGNNPDMVNSSSINPSTMIIIGLCVSNAITALSGCLIGEYNKTCDINMGTGMVTIALASLIIGETIFGRRRIPWRAFGVIFGACLYRVVVAIALRFNLPASALKLVSALIVAVAISYPTIVKWLEFENKKFLAQGKNLYRMLIIGFGAVTVLFIVLAVAVPAHRALFLLLAVLAVLCTIWSFRSNQKQGVTSAC